MKEIKFRGKAIESNECLGIKIGDWVYGSLMNQIAFQRAFIEVYSPENEMYCHFLVDFDSVAQFTWLKDKNGVEIYEGDIVRWDDCSNGRHWRIAIVRINPDIQFDCSIGLSYDGMKSSSKDIFRFGNFIYKDTHNHLEVVGNIHDNPELLKGGKE